MSLAKQWEDDVQCWRRMSSAIRAHPLTDERTRRKHRQSMRLADAITTETSSPLAVDNGGPGTFEPEHLVDLGVAVAVLVFHFSNEATDRAWSNETDEQAHERVSDLVPAR